MSTSLYALSYDANDPAGLARFWAGVLRFEPAEGNELVPKDNTGFRLRFLPSDVAKDRPNQIHFDLTSQTPEQQQETVARALELGGRHIDIGQKPEEGHVVLADPEGNEFCVIGAGNNFLKDTAFIGALSSDGSQAVGYFWSKALDWPLVWDQDEETAIQAPSGGPKITWGGPPVNPKPPKNRLHLDLVADGDVDAEVERLVALGATRLESGQEGAAAIPLADPDGNEFCILITRPA
ncbi:catechol 2,3-dioxygenase-like lactoylglutathione lyase family enzyme [Kribbella aluminosa]|uniref:Catechol 2,3-dioxygenase-like lactoylglutathione lyase family enzyme n=1 Tax=Kribbella aluminosa TaxID=416017 RepID=A0ABS4UPW3_9ACTN|nr:VOC family protein [Kribbella aluminosa]MBP2353675.1 catechol 2,3-dioxygenase-like lactoylglutathione lyase family enzyme [Kribbella aluminosa]